MNFGVKRKNKASLGANSPPNQDLLAVVKFNDEKKLQQPQYINANNDIPLTTVGGKPIYVKHAVIKTKHSKINSKNLPKIEDIAEKDVDDDINLKPLVIEGGNQSSRQNRIQIP